MVFEPLGRGLDGEMGCFSRHQWCHHVPSTPQAKSLFWSRPFNTSRLRSLARGRYHHLTHLRFHKMTCGFQDAKYNLKVKTGTMLSREISLNPTFSILFLVKKSNVSMNFPSGKPHGSWTGARILRISQWSCGLARRKS